MGDTVPALGRATPASEVLANFVATPASEVLASLVFHSTLQGTPKQLRKADLEGMFSFLRLFLTWFALIFQFVTNCV